MSINPVSESTEILTDEDIDLINNFVEKPNLKLLIFLTIFTILSFFASKMLDTYLPLIFFGFFMAVVAVWYFWMKSKIAVYTKAGTKKLIKGVLENKLEKTYSMKASKNFSSSTNTFCFFVLGTAEYMIPYQFYDKYNTGDVVCLHMTMKDDFVFNVTN